MSHACPLHSSLLLEVRDSSSYKTTGDGARSESNSHDFATDLAEKPSSGSDCPGKARTLMSFLITEEGDVSLPVCDFQNSSGKPSKDDVTHFPSKDAFSTI